MKYFEEFENNYNVFDNIIFFVYPIMAIVFSALMFVGISFCKYEILYGGGISNKDTFLPYEFLEFGCSVCLLFALFSSLQSYLKVNYERERVIERMLIFMLLASLLYFFSGLLCVFSVFCGHSQCLYYPFLPLDVWFIAFVVFLIRKKKRKTIF